MYTDEFDEERQKRVLEIRRKGMDLLARREHSYKELRQKLVRKEYPEEEISVVLQELQADGLLSDSRFAEAYIHSRYNRGYGPLRIQVELRERGVDPSLVEQFLHQDEFDWYALAVRVSQKRFGAEEPEDLKEKQRRVRFMQYRGFSSEHIKACLNDE